MHGKLTLTNKQKQPKTKIQTHEMKCKASTNYSVLYETKQKKYTVNAEEMARARLCQCMVNGWRYRPENLTVEGEHLRIDQRLIVDPTTSSGFDIFCRWHDVTTYKEIVNALIFKKMTCFVCSV